MSPETQCSVCLDGGDVASVSAHLQEFRASGNLSVSIYTRHTQNQICPCEASWSHFCYAKHQFLSVVIIILIYKSIIDNDTRRNHRLNVSLRLKREAWYSWILSQLMCESLWSAWAPPAGQSLLLQFHKLFSKASTFQNHQERKTNMSFWNRCVYG